MLIMNQQNKFMIEALKQAKKSLLNNDVPVGCVIVFKGKIIARAYNRRKKDNSTIRHCEIIAIEKACKKMGDWRLEGCSMYVTLEPCPMCAGAILQSRMSELFVGTMNPKAGCCGSLMNILNDDRFNHKVTVKTGIMKKECSEIITSFFKNLRKHEKRNYII